MQSSLFEKSLEEKATIVSTTPDSHKEKRAIIETDKLEGGNKTVDQNPPHSIALPTPNVGTNDTSRLLGNK